MVCMLVAKYGHMLIHDTGSRGPAVLDDFTSSYGYKFSDAAGRT